MKISKTTSRSWGDRLTVWGRMRARCAKYPLYMAMMPSVLIVRYKQSKAELYRLPVWLYMRDMMVSGGCMTQQTTKPLAVLLAMCRGMPSSMPRCFTSRLFAKKYVGSCTELPKPVRTMAGPTPR